MKKYLAVMAVGVLALGMKPNQIMAQDLTETMEQEKEDISTEEQAENGIVVLDNQGNFGIVDLFYMDNHDTIQCDYSEYEIPMGALCRLEIHPLSGYQVDFVKVNQNQINSENGVYEILMTESFTEISIGYIQAEEMQNSTRNELFKDSRIPDSGKNSVSAISDEVKVTYLNEEKEASVSEENTVDVLENAAVQTGGPERVDEIISEEMPVNEEVSKFGESAEKEPEEKKTVEKEPAEKKSSAEGTDGKRTEDEKPAVLEQENKVKEAEEETEEMEKTAEAQFRALSSEIEETSSKIPEKEITQIKKKSVLNISYLPLYLLAVCCIIIVRYMKKWIKKVEV
ncbi:MAG: hypothetical protein Q4F24_07395 [Eubacteriales bacterium]|nr:hypothetical protein [Eubacteriales bacterium]